jgi:hypothetical protein
MPLPADLARGLRDTVCLVVGYVFDVSVDAILADGRGGGRSMSEHKRRINKARKTAIYLTHIYGVDQETVSLVFKRPRAMVSRHVAEIEDLRDGQFDEMLSHAELAIKALLEAKEARGLENGPTNQDD